MVVLKMEVLSDSDTVKKKELITLDAKLLKNAHFYKEIHTLIKKATSAELSPQSNINKTMRTLKYDVKKVWKANTKKKRASLNSKIEFANAQLKSIQAAGRVKLSQPTLSNPAKGSPLSWQSSNSSSTHQKRSMPYRRRSGASACHENFGRERFPKKEGPLALANSIKLRIGATHRIKTPIQRNLLTISQTKPQITSPT